MNIFATDPSYVTSAYDVCDSHSVKMPLECAQMLSSAVWRYRHLLPPECIEMRFYRFDQCGNPIYRPAIVGMCFDSYNNHPCTLWAGENQANYSWLVKYAISLLMTYNQRYSKDHGSKQVIFTAPQYMKYLPGGDQTPFAQCITVDWINSFTDDLHEAYKLFIAYKSLTKIKVTSTGKEQKLICWNRCSKPDWLDFYRYVVSEQMS